MYSPDTTGSGRRRYLGTAAVGLCAMLAGCSDRLGRSDAGSGDHENGTAERERDDPRHWVPEAATPEAFLLVEALGELRGIDAYEPRDGLGGRVFDVDVTSIERRVDVGGYTALTGEGVDDEFTERRSLQSEGSHGQYERFVDDAGAECALTDGVVVFQRVETTGEPVDVSVALESVLDARAGETDRLVDADDDFAALADAVSSGALRVVRPTPDDDAVAGTGASHEIGDDESTFLGAVVFEDDAAADDRTDDELAREFSLVHGVDADADDVSRDGTLATVTGIVPTQEI